MSPRARQFLDLYERGWFPMDNGCGLKAYCYDPRGILPLDEFHVPRRLQRWLQRCHYRVTHNQAFEAVIRGCAERNTTWISQEIITTFVELHQLGLAHSMEAWQNSRLVGGLYGLALGGTFCGESMFYRAENASKACLVELARQLRQAGFALIDCQSVTPTLALFGARLVPFAEYFQCFQALRDKVCLWNE